MSLLLVSLTLGLAGHAQAWGNDGHMITGQVAASLLSADELTWVKGVLGGETLSGVATWADHVKFSAAYKWSRGLHFINLPDGVCTFDWDRDCKAEECVAGAIVNYTQRIMNPPSAVEIAFVATGCQGLHKADCTTNSACEWHWTGSWTTSCKDASGPSPGPAPTPGPSPPSPAPPPPSPGPGPAPTPSGPIGVKDEALRFITHYMGDIHQPLHVSWTSDLGGNKIHVEEGFDSDKAMNLHAVWDEGIIQKTEAAKSFQWDGYAAYLTKQVQGAWADKATTWASCLSSSSPDVKTCLTEIAQESITFACNDAYKDDSNKLVTDQEDLDQGYYTTRSPIVDQRLAAGGVRLAALIKYIKNAKEESLIMV